MTKLLIHGNKKIWRDKMNDKLLLSINHPVLNNHRVYGQELLPGLAYIDILFQMFREKGFDYTELDLRNLSIYNPLIVGQNYNVMLSIQCSENGGDHWDICVEGHVQREGTFQTEKKLYVKAEMHRKEPIRFKETLDLVQIEQSAVEIIGLDEVYEQYRLRELVHSGFMKAEGKIYILDNSTVIFVSLGQDALPSSKDYMFHPTLIDGSGIGAGVKFFSQMREEKRLFLPLFYKSFRASSLLNNQCITRVKNSSLQRKKELLYQIIEFFDLSGKKVAELKNLANKLVREVKLINLNKKETIINGSILTDKTLSTADLFLRQLLARKLGKTADQIETQVGYYEMGLDSPRLLEIVTDIETKIGVSLPPTLLFEYTTICELSTYLTENFATKFGWHDVEEKLISSVVMEPPAILEDSLIQRAVPIHSVATTTSDFDEDIAVIGIAGRYPQARNLREFWINLKEGKDCISLVPKSRWDWHQFEGIKLPSGKRVSKWGGFLDDPDCFDSYFFNISPREAETMDPQERLFLEICWEAIEDGGYTPRTLVLPQGWNKRRSVGVFVGTMHKDYCLIGAEAVSRRSTFPLSLSQAPIANRVSYCFNFHGPSMAVDTLCSSSLTAIHMALESIRHNECEVAIAGGVNLSLHPNKYISYGITGLHSSDGYCHSFGKGGDGYVSGEGIGAVLLKPLKKAIQDHDNIYAVIKGSAINHGGTVSGITVPNPTAQAELIADCLNRTGVNPRTISYVEAHGTGTSLGDPIEIEGLVKAYRKYTQDRQFCFIGSVKSNIGHAESAAGISGLHKTVLQLYYKTLVPSLHSEEINPYINLRESPFCLQHKTEEWKHPVIMLNNQKVSYPRRAALSSFGATGSNAHIILEEYSPKEMQQLTQILYDPKDSEVIIPLSAKSKERLQAYARNLLEFLETSAHSYNEKINLLDLAYTLQVGREAMVERVAFVVREISELVKRLQEFLENKSESEQFFLGQFKQSKGFSNIFIADEDSRELIQKWAKKGKLLKIAEIWAKGIEIDWSLLYGEVKPHRISLPTYPFARNRYWVPENETKAVNRAWEDFTIHRTLHPLLHQNTSDFFGQRFSSTFTGHEFYLADHTVKGQPVLPGVAYLEMVREAMHQAAGASKGGQQVIRLKNVVWVRPIIIGNQPVEIHIRLYPEDDGEVTFEIYSEHKEDGAEHVVHCQGTALLSSALEVPALNLKELQAQCSQGSISCMQCYEAYRAIGIEYGPAFQGINGIYRGADQMLAKFSLPPSVSNTMAQFVLHPSLMDSALQASIGSILNDGEVVSSERGILLKPALLFALQELEIINSCSSTMWALIRNSYGAKTGNSVKKLDIDLCDENGMVCVKMKGVSSRMLEGEPEIKNVSEATPIDESCENYRGPVVLTPVWDAIKAKKNQTFPSNTVQFLIVGGTNKNRIAIQQLYPKAHYLEHQANDSIDEIANKLKVFGSINHILWIAPYNYVDTLADDALIKEQNLGVLGVFKTVKALISLSYGSGDLGWTVITVQSQPVNENDSVNPTHATIHGFIGSMAKEYPNWKVRLIDLEADCDWPLTDIFALPWDPQGNAWVYRGREWYRQKLVPLKLLLQDQTFYKREGVYVVIGGAGGIGEVWSEYMIRTYQARIIWIGRRQKDTTLQARLDRLSALGSAPQYIAADATDLKAMRQAYQEIKERYTHINGVVHSAMVMLGRNLVSMDEEGFKNVLSAKVDISVQMAKVFQNESLDFVLFFSSINSFLKAPGQSNYSSGCTFKDAFSRQLSREWPCKVKVINWGYWGGLGRTADFKEFENLMDKKGAGLIETTEAMEVLEKLLAGPIDQIAFMKITKSSGLEGIKPAKELITVSTDSSPSNVKNLRIEIPEQSALIKGIISEMEGC